jgi:hypothetical protein
MKDIQAKKIAEILASADALTQVAPAPSLEGRIQSRLAVALQGQKRPAPAIGFRWQMAAAVLLLLVNTATLIYLLQPAAQPDQVSVADYWSFTEDNQF